MTYDSALTNKDPVTLTTWMYRKDIMLCEISQTRKDKHHVLSLTKCENVELVEGEGWWLPGAVEEVGEETLVKACKISVRLEEEWVQGIAI
jgi:hypothetical protein